MPNISPPVALEASRGKLILKVIVCLTVALWLLGCTTTRYGYVVSPKLVRQLVSERVPPMFIRLATATPDTIRQGEAPVDASNRGMRAAKDAFFAPGPGGSELKLFYDLIVPPIAYVVGTMGAIAENASIEACNSELHIDEREVINTLQEPFATESLDRVLGDQLSLAFGQLGLGNKLQPIIVSRKELTKDDLNRSANLPANTTVLLVNVYPRIEWGFYYPEKQCGFKLVFDTTLLVIELTSTGDRPLATMDIRVANEITEPKARLRLMTDPDSRKKWIADTAHDFAVKIAEIYVPP